MTSFIKDNLIFKDDIVMMAYAMIIMRMGKFVVDSCNNVAKCRAFAFTSHQWLADL